MIGYVITFIILLAFLCCGTVTILKHPKDLSASNVRLSAVAILVTYLYPLLEVVTNYSKGSFVYLCALPVYNVVPFLFLLVLCGSLLWKNRIGKFSFTAVSLMSGTLIYNIVQIGVYKMKTANSFSERDAIYLLGQVGVLLLCFSMIRNNAILIRPMTVLFSCVAMWGLYAGVAIYNAVTGKNVFGLSLTENAYFIFKTDLSLPPVRIFALNFAFLTGTMIFTALAFAGIQKKDTETH